MFENTVCTIFLNFKFFYLKLIIFIFSDRFDILMYKLIFKKNKKKNFVLINL